MRSGEGQSFENVLNFQPQHFHIKLGEHREKEVIFLSFPYSLPLIQHLKKYTAARWSATKKMWYLPDNNQNRQLCQLPPKIFGKLVLNKIAGINQPEFQKFQKHLILKGFSHNTLRTYTIEFAQLLYHIGANPVWEMTTEELQSYFLHCHTELKISENQIHVRMNAVKYYFEKILQKHKIFLEIPRPKKPSLLPKALNTDEVKKLFDVVDNAKHRLILQLCYGMGLRVSEIVNLKIADIDSKAMKVHIQRAKGKKDRYVNLPETVLQDLRIYYLENRPTDYLFEGPNAQQYHVRSVQIIFKNAMQKAGITKKVGVHGLRHSYATHLLEYGTDISLIQKLMGHNNIKTTLNYTNVTDRHISKVGSPLDKLK